MQDRKLTRREALLAGAAGVTTLLLSSAAARAAAAAPAAAAGTLSVGGDLSVNRMGFGAMRITGPDIWGEPQDPAQARAVLHRALDLGVNFIDTADAYGPEVSERLIAQALYPYPRGLLIATKGGLMRPSPVEWIAQRATRAPARGVRGEPQAPEARAHRPVPAAPHRPGGAARGVDR